jgi:hypothetical protein
MSTTLTRVDAFAEERDELRERDEPAERPADSRPEATP